MRNPFTKKKPPKPQTADWKDVPDPDRHALGDLRTQSGRAHSDTLGGYTGTDADGGAPVQDADDL